MAPVTYPPLELQADRAALTAISDGLAGYRVEALAGRIRGVWVRDRKGGSWLIAVEQRDLRFKFEVFGLGMTSIEQLRNLWRDWKPPVVTADVPEPFRSMMATRPPEPVAPSSIDEWPFKTVRVEVLRRAEFMVEDVDIGPTFGDNPNAQSAVAPGQVPQEASASCDVEVGLLFTGQEGKRFLIAADWMPMDLIATQEAAMIDEFVSACQRIELRSYMRAARPL